MRGKNGILAISINKNPEKENLRRNSLQHTSTNEYPCLKLYKKKQIYN